MSWVRLDDNFMDHPKVVALSATALRVWLRALCHCNQHSTGGLISDRVLARIGCTPKVRLELTTPPPGYTFGLLEPSIGGLSVHDYAQYQPRSAADQAESGRQGGLKSGEARRRKSSERHETHEASANAENEARARVPVPSRPVPSQKGEAPSSTDEVIPASESPSETRLRTPDRTPDPSGDHDIADAWAQGVTEGAGETMAKPILGAAKSLIAAIDAHGPPRTGLRGTSNVAAWARERGKAYGAAARRQPRSVFKFCDWLNAPDAPIGKPSFARPEPAPPPYHGPAKSSAPIDPDPVAPPPKQSPFSKAGGT